MPTLDLSDWKPPLSFDKREVKPWPRGVFPGPFEDFSSELARSTETPLELSALMMLATVATAAQGHFLVKVKDDYVEPMNIWTCVAMPPGTRKSAVQGACTSPLTAWERQQKEIIIPIRKQKESSNRSIEARLKSLRLKAASADGATFKSSSEEINAIEQTLEELPPIPQLWTSDVTPENLSVIMAEHNERMAILSDEGGIFDILAGRYSGGIPNLDLVLKAHAGTSCRVNRGNRAPVFLDQPSLTMGLSPQPDILQGMAQNKAFRGRGLIARFLYAVPSSNLGYRSLDAPPMDASIASAYHKAILDIIQLTERLHPTGAETPSLIISPKAYKFWLNFSRLIEIRMQDGGQYELIRDWAGKLPGAIVRIAGLLHIMKCYDQKAPNYTVDLDTMESAVSIGHCLQSHALAVFDLMGGNSHKTGALKVLDWLKRELIQNFTRRDCHYALKSYFKKVDDLKPSLELLENLYYIHPLEREPSNHRPSQKYEVNPYLYDRSD